MAHTIYAGNVSKRKNSTLQPTLTASFDVLLKTPTSLHTPTFTISASSFDYNYLKWGNRYYFVTDVVARNNSLWDVSAVVDVLATYKAEILASTQYVSYSSVSGGAWLADTRIPLLKNATVQHYSSTMNFLFTDGGFYAMSAIGQDGCHVYCMDATKLRDMINDISSWRNYLEAQINAALPHLNPTNEKECLDDLLTVLKKTGTLGDAYLNAPACIRSCIWIPLFVSYYAGDSRRLYLGEYDTGIDTYLCKTEPAHNTVTLTIPWQHTDWRRAICEEVYLYLPLVGLVNISSDEIVNETALTIEWSATATDGAIAYCVKAGNQVIGTYGANCAVSYPIGISQQASAGESINATLAGLEKVVSGAVNSSLSPISAYATVGNAILGGVSTGYDVLNIKFSAHNSCVGGIGGGAGVGLDLAATCYTVSHDTVVTPSAMQATMGIPTMKPIQLSSCSGYCQCTNAHVAAVAEAQELDEIDAFLNSGFYIE